MLKSLLLPPREKTCRARVPHVRPRPPLRRGSISVSDGAPEAASVMVVVVTPSGAPFGGFCLRLRSLCEGGDCDGRSPPPASCEPGITPQTPRDARPPPCVPHRHIRRPVGLEDGRIGPTGPPLLPCRRRETSFRKPFGMTSHVFPSPEAPSPPRCHA